MAMVLKMHNNPKTSATCRSVQLRRMRRYKGITITACHFCREAGEQANQWGARAEHPRIKHAESPTPNSP